MKGGRKNRGKERQNRGMDETGEEKRGRIGTRGLKRITGHKEREMGRKRRNEEKEDKNQKGENGKKRKESRYQRRGIEG